MKHELTKILDAIFHFYDLAGYFELLLVVERGGDTKHHCRLNQFCIRDKLIKIVV